MMEEVIMMKQEICKNVQMEDVASQEGLLNSGPHEPGYFVASPEPPVRREVDPRAIPSSSEPENQHLNAICLEIRIAIIRCFYSSLSCPTTTLQMLKKEGNELCVTINIEDIKFFVQKFEKTGSVISNHIDNPSMETEDTVNPHSMVETVFDESFSYWGETVNERQNKIDYSTNLSSSVSENIGPSPHVQAEKNQSIEDLNKEDPFMNDPLEQSQLKKKPVNKIAFSNQVGKKVGRKKLFQRFPPLGKYECRICKLKSPDSPSFKYHFLSHFNLTFLPKTGPHKCPACHKVFSRNATLYDHLFHSCNFKDYDFSQKQQYSDSKHKYPDTLNVSSSEIPKEEDCLPSKKYSSCMLDQIEANYHETDENMSSSQNSKKNVHKCPRCSEILPDRRSLTYHVLEHSDLSKLGSDPPYKCPECDKFYHTKQTLYKHLCNSCHKDIKQPDTPFNCHLCRKAFQFEIQLEHHILVHEGKAKLKECNFCGKSFNTTTGFRYHLIASHAEKKAHQCDQCHRYFNSLKLLEEHKTSHSGTFLFTCEICGKNWDTSTSYRAHLRRHTEKPEYWQCEVCGKYYSGKYKCKETYERHMRTHTQEIVAVCDFCGKGFNQKCNLKVHYKSCKMKMLEEN